MKVLFNDSCLNKTIRLRGKESDDTILEILGSREFFRVESEKNGPIISDYGFYDLAVANGLEVSLDSGTSWIRLSVG
jgi:hypothetical protein